MPLSCPRLSTRATTSEITSPPLCAKATIGLFPALQEGPPRCRATLCPGPRGLWADTVAPVILGMMGYRRFVCIALFQRPSWRSQWWRSCILLTLRCQSAFRQHRGSVFSRLFVPSRGFAVIMWRQCGPVLSGHGCTIIWSMSGWTEFICMTRMVLLARCWDNLRNECRIFLDSISRFRQCTASCGPRTALVHIALSTRHTNIVYCQTGIAHVGYLGSGAWISFSPPSAARH
mmetsp:Transcript_31402/g.81596  ORF Transcript_31402/g.81596 Transcript_31402/m.81596 type:complete len:232 (+) Transcript_31402:115-810(+)